ncbi:protein of unknown function DUF159 [Alkalilimnicola ehrlichii MLHE-1]|uniref:Abasic site processing protein n=2 Tax=Alkalilimnicola ehrlichii TaxID=351052 RepID=Q0A6Q3_ALKEH|nr:protein of unknown function DUF159 [Alkalilimnicola ehrlichii MLHE-1]
MGEFAVPWCRIAEALRQDRTMCGRFALSASLERIAADWFELQGVGPEGGPRYNITPGTAIPAFLSDGGKGAELAALHWGFRPAWAREGPMPINARAEKAATSPYFREAFARRRCLVPADGWFEWQEAEGGKQPYFVTQRPRATAPVLFLAGLWTPGPDGTPGSCAILTEPAAPVLAHIHHRQPVVLDPECRWAWLDPDLRDRRAIRQAVRRLDPARLYAYPVSRRVNRPAEDDPGLIKVDDGSDGGPT